MKEIAKIWWSGVLMLIALGLKAQSNVEGIEVAFGPMFSVSKRSVPTQFVGADDAAFYVVYSRGKDGSGRRYLHRFGYDLKPQAAVKLSTRLTNANSVSETVLMLKGNLYQVVHATFGNQRSFFVQPINKADLSLGPEEFVGSFSAVGGNINRSRTFINTTRDSSFVSITYTVPTQRKEQETFVVNVFNEQMQKLWSQQFEFPYENRLLELQEFRVDQRGNVYALAKRNFKNQRDRVGGLVNYEYLLFHLKRTGEVDTMTINSEGRFLQDMKVDITPEGDIVSAGFYSTFTTNGAGGAFYMRIDGKTREVISESFMAFDKDFMLQNMTTRRAERLEKRMQQSRRPRELTHYEIDELIPMSDGSVRMIGEQREIFTTSFGTGTALYTQTHYHFDDLVVVSISRDGEIDWAHRIAKRQHTVDDRAAYSSYALMRGQNELALLFNDNAQNLDYDGVGRVAPMARNNATVVMAARVGQFGDVRRAGLFRRGEAQIKIRPVFAHQLDEDEMLIFGHRELRNQRFVLLKFR